MSDDKKRDRALQRRVRERQAKTGESYQVAWRQLTGSDAPPAEGPERTALPPLSRDILSLQLGLVPPHQPTRITTRATKSAVDIEQVVISNAGTKGGAGDWVVNDIEVDGRSQLALKNLSGAIGSRVVRAETARSVHAR